MSILNELKKIMKLFILFCFLSISLSTKANISPKNTKGISDLKKQSSGLISNKVHRFMERAYDLASGKQYDAALKVLKEQLKKSYIKKGERAQILRTIGFIYAQKEDYASAVKYLQQALDTKKLSYNLHLETFFTMAQITIISGNYSEGQKLLEKWFSISDKDKPKAFILYAICLLEKKQPKKSLKYVEKTISMVSQPQESWLRFALSFYLNDENYKKAKPLLEKLVAQFPTRSTYWKQLAGVYLFLNDSKKALITLELAYKMGYLDTESQILNLAKLLIEQNIPFQAAQLLKTKTDGNLLKNDEKNLELMADAYMISRERKASLSIFSKIANISKSQKLYLKYGYILLQEEDWKKSESIFKKSLTLKKESDQLDKIYLGLGISLFYQNQPRESLKYFRKSFDINSEQSSAFYWIQHAEATIKESVEVKI